MPIEPFNVQSPSPLPANQQSAVEATPNDFLQSAIQETLKKPIPVSVPGLKQHYSYADAEPYIKGFGHQGFLGDASAEFNAEGQRWYHQLANGTIKGLGIMGGTFINSTAGFLNGVGGVVASKVTNGEFDFSRMYDNTTGNAVEDFGAAMEKWFPNYYSKREQDASALSMDNIWSMNFLADKLIKNAGFAAGAILAGYATAGLGEASGIAKAYSAARTGIGEMTNIGKLATLFKRGARTGSQWEALAMSSGDDIVNQSVKALTLAEKQATNVAKIESNFLHNFGMVVSSIGEANMEAIGGKHKIMTDLSDQEIARLGRPLTPEESDNIEKRASEAANKQWALNVALLNVTNRIQFPKIIGGNFSKPREILGRELNEITVQGAEKQALKKSIAGAGESYAQREMLKEKNALAKIWDVSKRAAGLISPSEMIEEGSQFVFEKSAAHHAGVLDSEYDYSTRGWLNRENDGTSKSLLEDMLTFGIPQLFKTKEGVESMLLGGLTGGIMEGIGGGQRKKEKQTGENTKHAIGAFNANLPTAYMQEHFKSGVRSVAQEQQHSQEVAKGDIFNATNIREDGFLNWVLPRLYYGRKDMAIDELKQFKSDQMSFDLAKKQLGLADTVTSADLDKDIDEQIAQIHAIDKMATHVESIRPMRYLKDGTLDPTTKGMLYSLYKIDSLEKRMDSLAKELQVEGLTDLHLLTDPKARKEAGKTLEEVRNSLTAELRANLKTTTKDPATYLQKLNDIERLQNARERFVNDYDQLRNDKFFTNLVLQNQKLDESITLDMYKSYEAFALQGERVGSYEGNTEARKLAAELSLTLESKLSNNVPITEAEIASIEEVLKTNNAFLLKEDKDHIESLIAQSKQKIQADTQLDANKKEANWTTLSNSKIDDINKMSLAELQTEKQAGEIAEQQGYAYADDDYLAAVDSRIAKLTTAENLVNAFTNVENMLNDANRQTEPESVNTDQIKRRIADKFVALSDMVIDGFELDKEGYDDLDMAEHALKFLTNLRRLFAERDDVYETKGFAKKDEYLKELDDKIATLNDIILQTKKNIENISKEDIEFAKNNHIQKAKIIGYDIETNTVLIPSLFDKIKELIGETKLIKLLEDHKNASTSKFIYELYQHLRNSLQTTGGATESLNQILLSLLAELHTKVSARNNLDKIWPAKVPSNSNILFESPYMHYDRFISSIFEPDSEVIKLFKNGRNISSVIKYLKENPTTATRNMTIADTVVFFENSEMLKSLDSLKELIDTDKNFNYVTYWQATETYVESISKQGLTPTLRQLQVIEELVLNYYKKIDPTKEFAGWAYMDGRIGSGKTKVIATGFINILQTLLNKADINDVAIYMGDIAIAGVNLELSLGSSQNVIDDIVKGTKSGGLGLDELITLLDNNDPRFKTHSLIIGDEMARPSNTDIIKLAKSLAKYNTTNGTDIRFVGMGDIKQMSENLANNVKINSLNSNIKITTGLASSYRSLLFSMNVVQNLFDQANGKNVLKTPGLKLVSNISDTNNAWLGVTGVKKGTSFKDAETEMITTVVSRSKTKRDDIKSTPSILVVVNEGQQSTILLKLISAGADMSNIRVSNVKDSQGLSFHEVFVHLDPNAAEFNTLLKYNSQMYTAIRGVFYVHITTLEAENINDISLGIRYNDSVKKIKQSQSDVQGNVTDIQKHLTDTFDPDYLKRQAAKTTAESKKPNGNTPPNGKPVTKPGEELPEFTNKDQTQETEEEVNNAIVLKDEAVDKSNELATASGFTANGSVTGDILPIDHPTSYAFNFGNIGEQLEHVEGDSVFLIPVMPSTTAPNQDAIRWQVMKEVTIDGKPYYQELGVLGDSQVIDLQSNNRIPVVTKEDRYTLEPVNRAISTFNGDFTNAKLFIMKPGGRPFNRNNSDIIHTQLHSANSLHYNYDYNFDPSIPGNETRGFENLINLWLKGMYRNGAITDTQKEEIRKNARVVVFGSSDSDFFKGQAALFEQANSTIPFKPGSAYIQISFPKQGAKQPLPQFIELQGRTLQMRVDDKGEIIKSDENTIINDWYIKPLTAFTRSVDDYHDTLIGILKENGITEDDLSDIAQSTSHQLLNMQSVIEEDVTEFKHGNSVYNKLMQQLLNMNFKPYTSKDSEPSKAELFYRRVFEKTATGDSFLSFEQKKILFQKARQVFFDAHGNIASRTRLLDDKGIPVPKGETNKNAKPTTEYINLDTGEITYDKPADIGDAQFIFPLLDLKKAGAPLGSAQAAMNQLTRGNSNIKITNSDGSQTNLNLGRYIKHVDEKSKKVTTRIEAYSLTASTPLGLYDYETIAFDYFYSRALYTLFGPQAFKASSMYQQRFRFDLELKKMGIPLDIETLLNLIVAKPEEQRFIETNDDWNLFLEVTQRISSVPNENGFSPNKTIGQNLQSLKDDILGNMQNPTGTHSFGSLVFTDRNGVEHSKPIGLRINIPLNMSDINNKASIKFTRGDKNDKSPFLPGRLTSGLKGNRFKNFFTSSFVSVDDTKVSIAMPPSRGGTTATETTDVNNPAPQPNTPPNNIESILGDDIASDDNPLKDESFDEDEDIPYLMTGDPITSPIFQDNMPVGDAITIEDDMFNYVKKFIPNITRSEFQVISTLQASTLFGKKDGNVWGAFKEGVIYAVQGNENDAIFKQVLKHEAFHKIFRQFLNPNERNRIINEARIEYSLYDLTPLQIEEYLAVNFQKRPDIELPNSLLQRFLNFIKKIYNLVFNNASEIEKFFQAIENGTFKQQVASTEILSETAFLHTLDLFKNKEYFLPVLKGLYINSKYNASLENHKDVTTDYDPIAKKYKLSNLPKTGFEIALKTYEHLKRRLEGDSTQPGLRSRFFQSHSLVYYSKDGNTYTMLSGDKLKKATDDKVLLYQKNKNGYQELTNDSNDYPKPLNSEELLQMHALMHLFSQNDPEGAPTQFANTSVYPIFLHFVNEHYPQDLKHFKYTMKVGATMKELQKLGIIDEDDTFIVDAAENEVKDNYNDILSSVISESKDVDPHATLGTSARTWLSGLFITNDDGTKSPINENQALAILYERFQSFPTTNLNVFLEYLKSAFKGKVSSRPANIYDTRYISGIIKRGDSSKAFTLLKELLGRIPTQNDVHFLSELIKAHSKALVTSWNTKKVVTSLYETERAVSMWDLYTPQERLNLQEYLLSGKKLRDDSTRFSRSGTEVFFGDPTEIVLYKKLELLATEALQSYTSVVRPMPDGSVEHHNIAFEPNVFFEDDGNFNYKGTIIKLVIKKDGKQVKRTMEDFFKIIYDTLYYYESPLADYNIIKTMYYRQRANNIFVDIVSNFNTLVAANMTQVIIDKDDNGSVSKLNVPTADSDQFKKELNLFHDVLRTIRISYTDQNDVSTDEYDSKVYKAFLSKYNKLNKASIDKADTDILDAFYKEFMNILGLTIDVNESYDLSSLRHVSNQILGLAHDIVNAIPKPITKDENSDFVESLKKLTKSQIRKIANFQRKGILSIVASSKNVEGKSRFSQDVETYGHVLLNRLHENSNMLGSNELSYALQTEFPHLNTSLYQLNPFNPFSSFIRTGTQGTVQTLDGTLSNEYPILLKNESQKDIINRMFNGYFIGAYNANVSSDSQRTIMASSYPVSDKSRAVMVPVKVLGLPNKSGDNSEDPSVPFMLKTMIKQRLLMPVKNDNVQYYSVWTDSKNKSILSGLSDMHIAELKGLSGTYTTLEELEKANLNLDKYVDAIIEDLNKQALEMVTYIKESNLLGAAITKGKYISAKYAIPLPGNLESIYNSLLHEGKLSLSDFNIGKAITEDMTEAEIEKENQTLFYVDENNVLHLRDYLPGNISSITRNSEYLMPLARLFMANTYINDFFLHQLVAGDLAFYPDAITSVKRLASPWGSRRSPIVSPFHAPTYIRTVAVDDITTYGYVGISPDTELIDGKLHFTEEEFKDRLKKYKTNNELDKAQLFSTLYKKRVWTDGAGWMTQRGRDHINKGYGRGMKMGNSIKPIMHGVGKDNPINNKYASTVMDDAIVKQFPKLLELRLQMDFYGLKGNYNRAVFLEKKRLFESLTIQEFIELNDLYYSQFESTATHPIIQAVPKSSIKYGNPVTTTGFDYTTNAYNLLDSKSVLDLDMHHWGQQLNPVDDAESRTSLPTQLLYFANTNGSSPELNSRIINALIKMQDLASADLYEKGLKPSESLSTRDSLKNVTDIVLDYIKTNKHHVNTAQALAYNYKMSNLPTFSGNVISSFNTQFQKNFLAIKFNGTKGVQVSQGLMQNALGEDLKWDPVNQVAEAYMPLVYQDQIFQANPELYKKWKSEKDPKVKLKYEDLILKSLPLTSLGFRVPSTGINSGVKIKIKGFLQDNTNRVVLPNEVTYKMGSDFDIDVLYIIRPNLYGATAKQRAIAKHFSSMVSKAIGVGEDEILIPNFEESLNDFNSVTTLTDLDADGNVITFNISMKDKQRLKKAYYENVFVYSYIELLSKASNLNDSNKAISFDRVNSILPLAKPQTEQQKAESTIEYADSLYVLLARLKDENFKRDYDDAKTNIEKGFPLFTDLNVQEGLEKRMNRIIEKSYNLTDFADRSALQLLNQTGKGMTGVFASIQKTLAYLQETMNTDFGIATNLTFSFNGYTYDGKPSAGNNGKVQFKDINDIATFDELQWLVNAAVDNAKEQILAKMNMNMTTANSIAGGLAIRMPMEHIMTILNQPVAKELAKIGNIDQQTISYLQHKIMSSLGSTDNITQRIENLTKKYNIGIDTLGVLDIGKFVGSELFSADFTVRPYFIIDKDVDLDIHNLRPNFMYKDKKYPNIYHAYKTWKSGTFNEKVYNSFDHKDKSDISLNANRKEVLADIIKEMALQMPDDFAKNLNKYSLLEFENQTNSNFNLAVIQGLEEARSVFETEYINENGLVSNDESFIASQLNVLDVLNKLQKLGDALQKVQRVLNIMQENPNQPVDMIEYETIISEVFDINKKETNDAIHVRNVSEVSNLKLPSLASELVVKEDFPLKNINFNGIPLFTTTYNNWIKHTANYLTTSMHVLNPVLKAVSNELQSVYKISPSSYDGGFIKESEKNLMIRNALIKVLYSKMHITVPNNNGNPEIVSMDTSNTQYIKKGQTFYGNRALAEQIIDLYYKSRQGENLNNYFINRLVIQPFNTFTGNQEITMLRINTSDSNEVAVLKSSFLQIDNEQRREFMEANPDYKGYWYSPLQIKLIQYGVISEGLTFGNTKINLFFPDDIRSQLSDEMHTVFNDLVANKGLSELTEWFGLQLAINNKEWLPSIKFNNLQGLEINESAEVIAQNNNNNLEDVTPTIVKSKKVIKAKSYKYDPIFKVYYNLLVKTDKDPKSLPPFYSFKYSNKLFTYMRVDTPLEKGAYYILLPNNQDRNIKLPNSVLQQGFSLKELMKGHMPLVHHETIIADSKGNFDLYTNSEFEPGSFIYGYDNKNNGYLQDLNKYRVISQDIDGKDDAAFKKLLAEKDKAKSLPADERAIKMAELNTKIEQTQIHYKLELVESNKTIQQLSNSTNNKTSNLIITTNQTDENSINLGTIKKLDATFGKGLFDPQYWSQAEIEAMNEVQQQLKCK